MNLDRDVSKLRNKLQREKERLTKELAKIDQMLAAFGGGDNGRRKTRYFSKASRRKMAQAQKRRWAAFRAKKADK